MKLADLKTSEKLLLLVVASLTILSFLGLAVFVILSGFSLMTWSIPHFWHVCFVLCSVSLGGWMIFYSAQLRLGGEVMVYRNNLLLLWFLVFAVLVSTIARFASPQRYIAILLLGLSLVAFYIAAPIAGPRMLIRLLKSERGKRPISGRHA